MNKEEMRKNFHDHVVQSWPIVPAPEETQHKTQLQTRLKGKIVLAVAQPTNPLRTNLP